MPERFGFLNTCTTPFIVEDQMTYVGPVNGPEKEAWIRAIAEELRSFEDNKVWEVSENASVVQFKWVP